MGKKGLRGYGPGAYRVTKSAESHMENNAETRFRYGSCQGLQCAGNNP